MAFKKGQSGNPSGKPKGALNRTTDDLRRVLLAIVNSNVSTIQSDLDKLEPKDRLKLLIEIMGYVVPKLQATAIKDFTIEAKESKIDLSKLSSTTLMEILDSCD
jgi:hypothetical protein